MRRPIKICPFPLSLRPCHCEGMQYPRQSLIPLPVIAFSLLFAMLCHCVQLAIRNALSLRGATATRQSHIPPEILTLHFVALRMTAGERLSYRAEAYAPFFVIPSVGDSRSRVYLLSIHATTYAISVQFTQGNALQFTFLLKNNSRPHRVQFTSVRTISACNFLTLPVYFPNKARTIIA